VSRPVSFLLSSEDHSTDLTLALDEKEGKGDSKRRGAIVLHLSAIETAKTGTITIRNAQLDIEPVERAADLPDS